MSWEIHRVALLLALLTASPLLAGCIGEDAAHGEDEPRTADATNATIDASDEDPWNGADHVTIMDHRASLERESDVLCALGGAPQLPRTGQLIPPGTASLEITVGIAQTSSGIQVGYVVDGSDADYATGEEKEITWLAQVPPGTEETFSVELTADQAEPTEKRWSFYYQLNPGAEELCYTGFLIDGERWTSIDAVRG